MPGSLNGRTKFSWNWGVWGVKLAECGHTQHVGRHLCLGLPAWYQAEWLVRPPRLAGKGLQPPGQAENYRLLTFSGSHSLQRPQQQQQQPVEALDSHTHCCRLVKDHIAHFVSMYLL